MVMIYVAVPTYGMIRDTVGPGETVFVLDSSLPNAHMDRPSPGVMKRIYGFLFPAQDVPVPLVQRIDLRGRVVYTDQTPYVGGIVELKSTPRYTRTDAGGNFVFVDVAEGAHTVSVLDEDGNVLATCDIEIERTLLVEDVELIRLPDGTFIFQVAVDVKVLEITLILKRDAGGNVIGLDRVELGPTPAGSTEFVPELEESPGGSGRKPGGGSSGGSGRRPGGGSSGSGAEPTPNPEPKPPDINVYDQDPVHYVRDSQKGVDVNIFGANKRIAPGMKGSYHFTVENRGSHSALYDVAFTVVDTLPDTHKIPMGYRLKADGKYVAGDADPDTWVELAKLYQDGRLAPGGKKKYTLDWYWQEGDRDNEFARYGGDPAYSYNLKITVSAESARER